jgi:LPS export ABC transporter protein LptC
LTINKLHKNSIRFLPIMLFIILLSSCEDKKKDEAAVKYIGPNSVVDNLSVMYSDSGRAVVKMTTAQQIEYQNEDKFYPKAVYVTFFDKNTVEYSSLRGDSARYFKQENYYKIMGNVFFFNRLAQQSLHTDELNWSPEKRKIYTDKAVQINTPSEEIHGIGMDARQDFSNYKIRKPTGIFAMDSLITTSEADSTQN